MNPMTKTELIAELAEATQFSKKEATALLEALAAIVIREVAAGGSVTLTGLGKFSCRERAARQVRNPATGETIAKPADKQVKFTMAKALKSAVS